MNSKSIKLLYILSNVKKSVQFELVTDRLKSMGYEMSYILLNPWPSELEDYLKESNTNFVRLDYTRRIQIPLKTLEARKVIKKMDPDIVHTHLVDANLVGLAAAKTLGIENLIYTRHHSSFHFDYHQHAILYDVIANVLSDEIIAINENVKKFLIEKEKNRESRIHRVYHGFALDKFQNVPEEMVEGLRSKYKIPKNKFIFGAISRYIKWKGLDFSIPAFKRLIEEGEDVHLVLANAKGPDSEDVRSLLAELPQDSYTEIEFETNLYGLYGLFDAFVHVPVDDKIEAFGQVYVEALAAGVPLIATKSGIGNEVLEDKVNSLVVNYKDIESIYSAMKSLISKKVDAKSLVEKGRESSRFFDIDKMVRDLNEIYRGMLAR